MFPNRQNYSEESTTRNNHQEESDEVADNDSTEGYSSYRSEYNAATNGANYDLHSHEDTMQREDRNGHYSGGSNGTTSQHDSARGSYQASGSNPSHQEARSGIVATHESTMRNLEDIERSLSDHGGSIRDVITKFHQQHEDNIHLLDFLFEEEARSLDEEEEDDFMLNSDRGQLDDQDSDDFVQNNR